MVRPASKSFRLLACQNPISSTSQPAEVADETHVCNDTGRPIAQLLLLSSVHSVQFRVVSHF
jgi:hypothetical protein